MSISSDRGVRGRPWVTVHAVHNALLNNHFLDVLELHGARTGLSRDDAAEGYDPAGIYALRMRRLSEEFRRQVIGAFARCIGLPNVACVSASTPPDASEKERAATSNAMERGASLIVGAVVADVDRRLLARIPMLLRADVANEMLDVRLPSVSGRALSQLYVAVGVKRRPVETYTDGVVRRNSLERVQIEMWLWNRLLLDVQGCDLGTALLVGLHPKRCNAIQMGAVPAANAGSGGEAVEAGKNAQVFDTGTWKLASVPFGDAQCARGVAALEALAWRVEVVDDGRAWIEDAVRRARSNGTLEEDANGIFALASLTADPRLRPNMKCASMYDWPWAKAKRELAIRLCELTLVSGISRTVTSVSMAKGIPNDYSNEQVTARSLGISSQFTETMLEMCKPEYNGPLVTPALIGHNSFNWRRLQAFNSNTPHHFDKADPELPHADERTFYVDFELASPEYLYTAPSTCGRYDTNDAGHYWEYFDVEPSLPAQDDATAEALIFMIGCGQVIKGEWQHRVFASQALSQEAESTVIREWLFYMDSMIPPDFGQPILNVWGPEKQLLRKALRRLTPLDAEAVKDVKFFKTVNVLQVITQGGLSIKGNLSNSLKTVCTALEGHGLLNDFVQRSPAGGVSNGADAMALGLDSAEVMHRERLPSLSKAPKMELITRYNEADCRDIARIITYLREHH